jgi:uncharacterized surface protein with fasciclin (FAS1) repeats
MIKFKLLLFPLFIMILIVSCRNDLKNEKYQRPEWLAGKVYTQILEQPELSTFAYCIERVGYDSILDVSGSYTVFAPSNDAWSSYFSANSKYNTVDDIPIPELERMVKYHIVQNPWSKIQLQTLDVYGWIDTLDLNNNKPRGFKRETLLLEKDTKYGVTGYDPGTGEKEKIIIVDTTKSIWHRRAITDSRKYAPIFYQQYFDIYKLNKSDYEFYFDRTFDGSNDIYFAGAKVVSNEIFAENGFVYIVDKVVEPLNNAMEIITKIENADQYKLFLDVVNLYPKFEYNERKTMEQPGASEGIIVDSLFNLSFPDLTFDVNAEKTSPPTGTYGLPQNVTIRYHHGFMAPTNNAFASFINEYIKIPGGWGTFKSVPDRIKKIIVKTYMSANTIYPSDFEEGFYNGESDIVRLDMGDIAEKKFGSNCSFLGLNKAIVPRAFKSVTGPVYLQQGYSKVMYGIEESGLLAALKRENKDYMFFVESDANTSLDSSFFYHPNPIGRPSFSVILRSPKGFKEFFLTLNDLRTMFLNQVAVRQPKGIARKEFIPNLAGNYIIINNETGEYSGTGATTDGYHGIDVMPEYPRVLSDKVDNGTTYSVKNWFSFTGASLFTKISSSYPKFHGLLQKAGLSNDKAYSYKFISDNEFYTVFIPSDEALDSAKVDLMPKNELVNFLKLHFVQGEMIFTDASSSSRYYETTRIDERSTEYTKFYTKIYIEPGIDEITIPDKSGAEYVSVEEADNTTNILTAVNMGEGKEVFPVMFNNAVIHEIDKALKIEELDTK